MSFFGNLFKSEFEKWVEGASHEELSDAYEEERQKWIREGYNGGTGEKTSKMNRLNDEISQRVAEEWENDPRRNKDPNFRWTKSLFYWFILKVFDIRMVNSLFVYETVG